jgi:hypothetical protein
MYPIPNPTGRCDTSTHYKYNTTYHTAIRKTAPASGIQVANDPFGLNGVAAAPKVVYPFI